MTICGIKPSQMISCPYTLQEASAPPDTRTDAALVPMRIAISGSHLVGKTSLAEALADTLPRYELFAEPYHLLEEEGYEYRPFHPKQSRDCSQEPPK